LVEVVRKELEEQGDVVIVLPDNVDCFFIKQYVFERITESPQDICTWKLRISSQPLADQRVEFAMVDSWEFRHRGKTIKFTQNFLRLAVNSRPAVVVCYTQRLKLLRELEVFYARTKLPVKTVILKTGQLIEDIIYNTTYEAEDQAFRGLADIEGSNEPFAETEAPVVVVDWRDFKSSLPLELSRVGFRVACEYLKIGDYLLSPKLCIERKRVGTNDLRASLTSSRLENQVNQMALCYEEPVLLIECDVWMSETQVLPRPQPGLIANLLKKYPSLRVVWSFSAEQSAQLLWQMRPAHLYSLSEMAMPQRKGKSQVTLEYFKVFRPS
jgi:ERCC4-type nuclease